MKHGIIGYGENWNDRYVTNNIPWNNERSDYNLHEIVAKHHILPCKTLDIGCGTGSDAIWLSQPTTARDGFTVTAIDISKKAIQIAIKKAAKAKALCNFIVADFMKQKIDEAPFKFIFDRGCFHSGDTAKDRCKFAKTVYSYLERDGLWLTLVGSSDEPPQIPLGPPQRSAGDIINAIEPYFKIITLHTSELDLNLRKPPKAWICLMRKRD